jgi:hypothetical protein
LLLRLREICHTIQEDMEEALYAVSGATIAITLGIRVIKYDGILIVANH